MATTLIRKIIKVGGSLAVTLPPQWTKGKLFPGDEVALIADSELRLMPVHDHEAKSEVEGGEDTP